MKKYIVLNKNIGETPLVAVRAWQTLHPHYAKVPVSYAGRLDPMAEGKLLVLLGEECKKQTKYTNLDKEYEIEVLLDVGSDTGDALGLVSYAGIQTSIRPEVLATVVQKERGTHTRAYPAFSSKTVHGKPLFLHALEGTLPSVKVPEHIERIYAIRTLEVRNISKRELEERIEAFLALVPQTDEPSKQLGADFRITSVRDSWRSVFAEALEREFAVVALRVVCGSGTYMRSLAPRIGEALATKALALRITRTKIGTYWNGVWLRSY